MKNFLLKKSFNLFRTIFLSLIICFITLSSCFAQADVRRVEPVHNFVFDSLPLNLEEITDSADRVFAGVCETIESLEKDPASNLPVVKYTFTVSEAIKGVTTDKITFTQWKPTAVDAGYEIGQKYVIFLYPDSRLGLTSPVGYMQGKFEVEKKGSNRGSEYIRNKLNNVGLSKNLRTRKRISIGTDQFLNDYINECSSSGKSIRYKDFIKAVKGLSRR